MIVIENVTYLEVAEVAQELGISKPWFYENVRPRLHTYRFGGKAKPYYKKADVLALKRGRPVASQPPIVIGGILRDWTQHVRALGFQIDTVNREIKSVPTPINHFGIEEGLFVERSRISFVNRTPICIWSSYYPLPLVADFLDEIKANGELDVVRRIKEQHGLVIGWATERYQARLATSAEQEILQLLTDEPVLTLQRASYTADKQTLVLYSDMVLLGAWFAPEVSYDVNIW